MNVLKRTINWFNEHATEDNAIYLAQLHEEGKISDRMYERLTEAVLLANGTKNAIYTIQRNMNRLIEKDLEDVAGALISDLYGYGGRDDDSGVERFREEWKEYCHPQYDEMEGTLDFKRLCEKLGIDWKKVMWGDGVLDDDDWEAIAFYTAEHSDGETTMKQVRFAYNWYDNHMLERNHKNS